MYRLSESSFFRSRPEILGDCPATARRDLAAAPGIVNNPVLQDVSDVPWVVVGRMSCCVANCETIWVTPEFRPSLHHAHDCCVKRGWARATQGVAWAHAVLYTHAHGDRRQPMDRSAAVHREMLDSAAANGKTTARRNPGDDLALAGFSRTGLSSSD